MIYLFGLIGFFFGFIFFGNAYVGVSFSIFSILVYRLFYLSDKSFVFREWAIFLYCINYLISPAITYSLPETEVQYGMKIDIDYYYNLALPGYLLFVLGMFIFRTNIFKIDFKNIQKTTEINAKLLKYVFFTGLLFKLVYKLVPGELEFILYLSGLLRFVAAFALFSSKKEYWWYPTLALGFELGSSFLQGMYHDAIMWLIFFAFFFVYVFKLNIRVKIIGFVALSTLVLFLQAIKQVYREQTWLAGKEGNFSTFANVGETQLSTDTLIGTNNLLSTLNRGNQAWIFASTVDNLDKTKNFQDLTIVSKYFEAAMLPRFLAPNKIKSGDKEIFNEFSGHFINENTSMGLGIFADGYVAYGPWGVYIFGFVLGLIFSLTFKIVERWSKVSPFYVLLLLPLLNYAVRPDCELQTTINHLFKGILLYGFLVYLTRKRFTLDSQENQRKLLHLNLVTTKK